MRMPGSQVVDFIVWTKPTPHAFKIDGKYWHETNAVELRDRLADHRLERAFNGNIKIHHIPAEKVTSIDEAISIIRKEL